MLCVLTTDADLTADDLDAALRAAVRVTFDRLDTDGCMSTNDTVLLLASGAAGVEPGPAELHRAADRGLRRPGPPAPAGRRGREQGDRDRGRRRGQRGRRRGRRPRGGPQQPAQVRHRRRGPELGPGPLRRRHHRGRFEPDRLNVAINGVWVCRNGCAGDDRSKVDMRPRDVTITVDLSAGPHAATIPTTDLTADYVHENSAYST